MNDKRAETGYWVMRCPVISTAHMTEDVAQELADTLPGEDVFGCYCAVTGHGGFVRAPDDEAEFESLPVSLRDCLRWAKREGFEWLRFDADGDQIGELTVYEW